MNPIKNFIGAEMQSPPTREIEIYMATSSDSPTTVFEMPLETIKISDGHAQQLSGMDNNYYLVDDNQMFHSFQEQESPVACTRDLETASYTANFLLDSTCYANTSSDDNTQIPPVNVSSMDSELNNVHTERYVLSESYPETPLEYVSTPVELNNIDITRPTMSSVYNKTLPEYVYSLVDSSNANGIQPTISDTYYGTPSENISEDTLWVENNAASNAAYSILTDTHNGTPSENVLSTTEYNTQDNAQENQPLQYYKYYEFTDCSHPQSLPQQSYLSTPNTINSQPFTIPRHKNPVYCFYSSYDSVGENDDDNDKSNQ